MAINELFGICITTFNRSKLLEETLMSLLPEVIKFNIPIYISDNASVDNTEDVVNSIKLKYPNIYYHSNSENLGIDNNMINVIEMAETKYALWFSDDDKLENGAIENILDYLKESPSLLILRRGEHFEKDFKNCYTNPFDFFYDNGMIGLTGMHYSTLVVDVKSAKKAIFNGGLRFRTTLHAYAGIILDYILEQYKQGELKIIFTQNKLVNINKSNPKSWNEELINVFLECIPLWYSLLKKEYKSDFKVKKRYKEYKKKCNKLKFLPAKVLSPTIKIISIIVPNFKLKKILIKTILNNK